MDGTSDGSGSAAAPLAPLDAELRRSEGDVERLVAALALVFVVLRLLAMASDERRRAACWAWVGRDGKQGGVWCCSSRAVILREGE